MADVLSRMVLSDVTVEIDVMVKDDVIIVGFHFQDLFTSVEEDERLKQNQKYYNSKNGNALIETLIKIYTCALPCKRYRKGHSLKFWL